MASTSDIRNGLMIRHKNDIYQVVDFLHVKPGKGAAFVRTTLKSLTTGKVLEETFRIGVDLDDVRIERRKFQFSYKANDNEYVFMNTENWEEQTIPAHKVEGKEFLLEGAECEAVINADEDNVLTVSAPTFVTVEITYTENAIKGDTVTNTMKPATVETGAEVKVPLFCDTGEKIKIDTRTGTYVERVKSK